MPSTPPEVLENLLVASHRLTRIAAATTGSTTPAAVWRTLSILIGEGPIRVGELARASRITQPGMTKLLREMVADELVYRIADVDDARAWLVAVTSKGEAALERWRVELTQALQPLFADLDEAEWELLDRATTLLAAHTRVPAAVA